MKLGDKKVGNNYENRNFPKDLNEILIKLLLQRRTGGLGQHIQLRHI